MTIAKGAEETISYGIPTFKLYGHLVGFAAFKQHLSFFVMSARFLKTLKKEELKGIDWNVSTIKFSPEKPLPVSLVKKIVQLRLQENKTLFETKYGLPITDLKLSQPAIRALLNAKIKTTKYLKGKKWESLKELHGIGPSTLPVIKKYL